MFYAVILCGNTVRPDYLQPMHFMTESTDKFKDVTLVTKTKKEMIEKLKDLDLYKSGWIKIVKID